MKKMAFGLMMTAIFSFLLIDHFTATTVLLAAELLFFSLSFPSFLPLSLLAFSLCLAFLFTSSYPVLVAAQTLSFTLGFLAFFSAKLGHGWHVFGVFALVLALFLLLTALTPSPFLRLLRGKPPAPATETSDYYICKRDVTYDSAYPRNNFDLYTTTAPSSSCPVFLFIHGGGFCGGDKGHITSGIPYVLQKLTEAGFAVVSANYAVAPEYPYPAPLYQLTELVGFLRIHAEEYGLDMTRVVLGGESSGGQVMGQFAALQTNPAYAAEMGIDRVFSPQEIKAIYFGCALFDPSRFSHTGLSAVADYPLFQMGRGYFRTNSPFRCAAIEQANVFAHITPDFPATYITDGNFATFDKQAREMVVRLQEAGVECEAFLHDGKGARFLPHGYDLYDGAESRKNADRLTEFLRARIVDNKQEK